MMHTHWGQQSEQSAAVNTAFAAPLAVSVSSPAGEPVAGGLVTFAPPSSGASAVLSATMVTLDSSGQGSVTATANTVAGSYMVAVSAGGANALADVNLTNRAGAVSHFGVIPSTTTPKAGVAFFVTVVALDGYGNRAGAYRGTVHFTSSDVAAVLPADYMFTGVDSGKHTFKVTLNPVGPQTVTVTDKVHGAIKGTAHVTVQAAASVAGTWLAREIRDWRPDALDAFYAAEGFEMRGVLIGGH
jgi:hypothetical protein